MNPFLAIISGSQILSLVVTIIVVGLIYWLLIWLIGAVGLTEPFNKVARVILMVLAVFFLINALLQLVGHGFIAW